MSAGTGKTGGEGNGVYGKNNSRKAYRKHEKPQKQSTGFGRRNASPIFGADEKSRIYYPREYRHFQRFQASTIPFLLLCVAPAVLAILFFYPDITGWISGWTGDLIYRITGIMPGVESGEFLGWMRDRGIQYLSFPGSMPGFLHSVICVVACVVLFIAAAATPKLRPLMIYLCMGLFVQFISALFFIFASEHFPYSLTDYSELYMEQQIGIWLMLAVIIGISVSLSSAPGFSRVVVFYGCLACSFVFGCLRYVVYIVLLHYCSSLYMASLFFTFGVFFDFLQMVALYAVFIRYQSSKINAGKGQKIWQWS
jgi:hypothetical protein